MKRKQQIRKNFREACFERDNHKCKICGDIAVDAHHIFDRNLLPNGGYVKENGISVCPPCHLKAEKFHISEGKEWEEGYHPDDLYRLIGSDYQKAYKASLKI